MIAKLQNEPRAYNWMKPDFVVFLDTMHKSLAEWVYTQSILMDSPPTIQYFNDIGESSFIAFINTDNAKYIFKSTSDNSVILTETAFLKKWSEQGVSIPRIIDQGELNGHTYVLMDYIDKPLLCDAYSVKALLSNDIVNQMGSTLSKMHQAKGIGYGLASPTNLKGEFDTYENHAEAYIFKKSRLDFLRDKGYLDEEAFDKLLKAVQVVADDIEKNSVKSALCHMDFSVYNIFATNPIIVFDPNPTVNHSYIDLAQSLIIMFNLTNDISGIKEQFLGGYFQSGDPFREGVLNASLYIQGIQKISTWLRKRRFAKAKELRNFISTLNF